MTYNSLIRPPDIGLLVSRLQFYAILPILRPLDMSADLYFTGILLLLSSFFFRLLLSIKVAERNSTKIGHMVGSKCNLKMHVQNLGYLLSYKSGVQKPPFLTTSQLNGNFDGLSGKKRDIDNRASALTTTTGLLHRLKT